MGQYKTDPFYENIHVPAIIVAGLLTSNVMNEFNNGSFYVQKKRTITGLTVILMPNVFNFIT